MIGQFEQREPFQTRHRQMLANDIRNAYSAFKVAAENGGDKNLAMSRVGDAVTAYRKAGYNDAEDVVADYMKAAWPKVDI